MKRLQKIATGEIFAWDPVLATNPKMREIEVPDEPVKAAAPAKAPEPAAADATEGGDASGNADDLDALDKDALLARAEAMGLEVDRRYSEATLRAKIRAGAEA